MDGIQEIEVEQEKIALHGMESTSNLSENKEAFLSLWEFASYAEKESVPHFKKNKTLKRKEGNSLVWISLFFFMSFVAILRECHNRPQICGKIQFATIVLLI